jgi:hypothetical protein
MLLPKFVLTHILDFHQQLILNIKKMANRTDFERRILLSSLTSRSFLKSAAPEEDPYSSDSDSSDDEDEKIILTCNNGIVVRF